MTESVSTMLDTWIEDLNAKQVEAYAFDGHCAVLAGPGSGKDQGARGKGRKAPNSESGWATRRRLRYVQQRSSTRDAESIRRTRVEA